MSPAQPAWPGACGDDPVFSEPWQAQAFAMTLALHRRGLFTWPEWAEALAAQIAAAQAAGDADRIAQRRFPFTLTHAPHAHRSPRRHRRSRHA